ncbi:hypothetical protein ACFQ22_01955 [Lentilactobacillus raoultii]|uniref:Uncharacterized protein n=1 Tax=Lentilactobacillus raoultii TaxID=1987503 RepID=A0ABW3PL55_9LACO
MSSESSSVDATTSSAPENNDSYPYDPYSVQFKVNGNDTATPDNNSSSTTNNPQGGTATSQ